MDKMPENMEFDTKRTKVNSCVPTHPVYDRMYPWEVSLSFPGPLYGKNEGYRDSIIFREWEKTHDYDVSSSNSSDLEYDGNKEQDKYQDESKAGQEDTSRSRQVVYDFQQGRMVPKLREPRQLYASSKELGPQQAARWPSEIEVQEEGVKHIPYVPPVPEPFYKPTGYEKRPLIQGEEQGRVVYEYEPMCGPFFLRSRVGGHRSGCHHVMAKLESEDDKTLLFESRFESGNLQKAIQVGPYEYELWLRNDLYTNKHTQWFYFCVSNTRANVPYRFTIVNLMKSDSLYNNGMKPLMYSNKRAQEKKQGWLRTGKEIKYYKNNATYPSGKGEKNYYALTFVVEFPHDKDSCYLAHCYPYTYSDLQDYLYNMANDPIVSKICKQRVLCRTLAGNLVYVLTITSPNDDAEKAKHKKAVVVTSRVHPGESNSSWMMKGFLDYLTGNSADAKLLRDTFVFKIVPMINPDGVIVGNYRCSLSGRDLNRNYKSVLKDAFPAVWHTKNMIKRLAEEREIIVYCDLHGHSRKQNVFIYGCENRQNPSRRLRERIFPVMLSRNAPDKFKFEDCKFKVQKSKEGTGRIVVWNFGIMNSYTMEATFCGSTLGKKKNCHFNTADFEAMGFHFCDTLLDYCDPDPTKCAKILSELEEHVKQEILARLEKQRLAGLLPDSMECVDISEDFASDLESSDGGSDSSVSDGLPVQLQYLADSNLIKGDNKKKKLKSKKERDQQRSGRHSGQVTVRYSSGSAKSRSGRSASVIPTHTHIRSESRAEKKRETEYLEALTNAYLKSGVLQKSEQPKATFRYTNKPALSSTVLSSSNSLAPLHESNFAARFVSHIHTFSSPGPAPVSWLDFGINGRRTPLINNFTKRLIKPNTNIQNIANRGDTEEYARFRLTKRENTLNFRNSVSPGGLQHHISESFSAQRKHTDARNGRKSQVNTQIEEGVSTYSIGPTTSAFDVKRFTGKKVLGAISKNNTVTAGTSATGSEGDDLSTGSGKPIKQHPPPFDQVLEREQNGDYLKRGSTSLSIRPSRTPSATATFTRGRSPLVEQESIDLQNSSNDGLLMVGGKGSRESLEHMLYKQSKNVSKGYQGGSLSESYNAAAQNKHPTDTNNNRRVRSVNNYEITTELKNVKQLRQSLSLDKIRANCSPTTGKYIDRIVREADYEIAALEQDLQDEQLSSEFRKERQEFSVSQDNVQNGQQSLLKGTNLHSTPGPQQLKDYIKPGERITEKNIRNKNSEVQKQILQQKSGLAADDNGKQTIESVARTEIHVNSSNNGNGDNNLVDSYRNGSATSNSSQDKQDVSLRRESLTRGKLTPRSQSQTVGPTRVSLMISHRHSGDAPGNAIYTQRGKFTPLVRANRHPLLRHPRNKKR